MNVIPLTAENLDPEKRLMGYRIHDSRFAGMVWDGELSLKIKLRRVDDRLLVIHLGGLEAVGLRKFRDGAIAFEAYVWDPENAPSDSVTYENGFWPVLFGNDLHSPDIERAVASRLEQRKFNHMFFLDCSTYGGYLAALCRVVSFEVF